MTTKEANPRSNLLRRIPIFLILACLLITPCIADTLEYDMAITGYYNVGAFRIPAYWSADFDDVKAIYSIRAYGSSSENPPNHDLYYYSGDAGTFTIKIGSKIYGYGDWCLINDNGDYFDGILFEFEWSDFTNLSGSHYGEIFYSGGEPREYIKGSYKNPYYEAYTVALGYDAGRGWAAHYIVEYDTEGWNPTPEYEINFTATSQFCYGSPVYFNLSELTEQVHGDYYINMYHYGEYYNEIHSYSNGPLLYSTTLTPGGWSVCGSIIPDAPYDEPMYEWLNFTIFQNCSLTYPITINPDTDMEAPTEYTWNVTEWPFNDPPPWDWDLQYGNNYAAWLYNSEYINETEYNQIMTVVNYYLNQSANVTEVISYWQYGLLAPIYMINDAINTTRTAVNTSYGTLNNSISPITSIFDWIFEMMPPIIQDLGAVILTLGLVKVVLSWRKD